MRPEDRLAWVEPGLFNLDLRRRSRRSGFTYAPDPSSQQTSSIGGNVNTNAGGPHCLAYGVTSAHVLALDVVLPDGTLERFGSEGPEAAGYDLRGVVVGSEGHAGHRGPGVRAAHAAPARRAHDAPGLHLGGGLRGDGARPSSRPASCPAAVEMMDHGIVVAAENFAHAGYPTDAAAILIVEVDGIAEAVEAQIARRGGRPPARTTSARSAWPPTTPSAR